jgi:hypothetical protein
MSYDALMRWEWEGGAAASARERHEATATEPAEDVLSPPEPAKRRRRARRAGPVSASRSEDRQSDGGER